MFVMIVLHHSNLQSGAVSSFECDALSAAQRALEHSNSRRSDVSVQALGFNWLHYRSGELIASYEYEELLGSDHSYSNYSIDEMVDMARCLEMTRAPKRFLNDLQALM